MRKGESKPLLGLPITVKESFNVAGLTTTWGNPSFMNWVPEEDALIVSRPKEAGAIIIGKTNVPCMLRDWQTYNEIYGTTTFHSHSFSHWLHNENISLHTWGVLSFQVSGSVH